MIEKRKSFEIRIKSRSSLKNKSVLNKKSFKVSATLEDFAFNWDDMPVA